MPRVLVDSSVWIAHFNGARTPQVDALADLARREQVVLGDLILMEVLRGFRSDSDYHAALRKLMPWEIHVLGGRDVALQAADSYRALRAKGITVRRSVDMLIATYCIVNNLALLHFDRDFDVMEQHLGLEVHRG